MNTADFMAEAENLSRVGYLLRSSGPGEPVAYWHGIEVGKPCICFAHQSRWLTVSLDDEAGAVHVSNAPLRSEIPLYAEKYLSLPPIDALFLLGSDKIERFLSEHDWPRSEPFNSNFPNELAHDYERIWQRNCPMYRKDVAAVLGGWNMPWPEGDFEQLISAELLVWTFEQSEPWVEAYYSENMFRVFQRIT